jgi:replicative DNA helicase
MVTRLSKIVTDSGPTGMVPPHNLEAEESVLGACLLSRQAIATALELLAPEDFYKPAHAEMFRIMLDLYARGEPLDAVTMGEELRRRGKLEEFGGKPYLFTLVSSVPTPGSVGHYARIVVENATLRRLIDAAQQIRDLAFALPEDVTQAVDQAEDLIYQVTNRRVSEDITALKDLLTENMELVEKLYERGSAITGVATGFTDLDELTAGLQPSNLVIVAARPSMGKALALDTPIATPAGWSPMGDLQVGAAVFDERGRPCRVVAVSEVFEDHDCYEVVFDDGATLVADAGHQWLTTCPRRCRPEVVTTQQIAAAGLTVSVAGLEQRRWYVRAAEALELPEAALPVDPYVLGCCLAAGDPGRPASALSAADRAGIAEEFLMAGASPDLLDAPGAAASMWPGGSVGGGPGGSGSVGGGPGGSGSVGGRPVRAVSGGGPVPRAFLRASFKQRLALLQGIMDLAGTVTGEGGVTVELRLSDRHLLGQVHHLVCSLGHKPDSVRGWAEPTPGPKPRHGWVLRWNPPDPVFRLAGKAAELATLPQGVAGVTPRRCIVDVRRVPPVAVRCIQVDSPSHLYLAGPSLIPTHNSALALSMAQHVATNDRVPVVYFSLEMSKMELVQRLMCSEARVDSNRLRKGALQDSDWPKLSLALGRLAEAPIFIDDTPNATIMEMRAKCRRVASKGGLGLVIIDYLQLMAPLKRTDNRVQEVSEISRSLKILARELEVPVIALSQLSRNVEYRADKRPLLADLRESGCVTADTRILRADTGAEVPIGELLESGEKPLVWALDAQLRLVPRLVEKVFESGVKEVFEVLLASGRSVKASANHPFLTPGGWMPLRELLPGSRVGTPRRVPEPQVPHGASLDAQGTGDRDPGTWLRSPVHRLAAVAPPPGQEGLARLAVALGDRAPSALRRGDVCWDQIVALTPLGEHPVYDATIADMHNFIGNGIILHNSIEQDADIVMFIYRDEVYHPDSPQRGIAELHISKHRSGPIGKVELTFLEHYTKFANLARGM